MSVVSSSLQTELRQEMFHGMLNGTTVAVKIPIEYDFGVRVPLLYRSLDAKDCSGLCA